MEEKCHHCGATEEEKTIKKCVMCFRMYCTDCEVDRGGRKFCSKHCSDFFFFGDED